MSIKTLREELCRQQVRAEAWPSDIQSAVDVLINMIDRHRPLGSSGSHGGLHTPTCGCEPDPLDAPCACGHPLGDHRAGGGDCMERDRSLPCGCVSFEPHSSAGQST